MRRRGGLVQPCKVLLLLYPQLLFGINHKLPHVPSAAGWLYVEWELRVVGVAHTTYMNCRVQGGGALAERRDGGVGAVHTHIAEDCCNDWGVSVC